MANLKQSTTSPPSNSSAAVCTSRTYSGKDRNQRVHISKSQSLNFCRYPNSLGSEVSRHQQKTEPVHFLTAMEFVLYLTGFGEGRKMKKEGSMEVAIKQTLLFLSGPSTGPFGTAHICSAAVLQHAWPTLQCQVSASVFSSVAGWNMPPREIQALQFWINWVIQHRSRGYPKCTCQFLWYLICIFREISSSVHFWKDHVWPRGIAPMCESIHSSGREECNCW